MISKSKSKSFDEILIKRVEEFRHNSYYTSTFNEISNYRESLYNLSLHSMKIWNKSIKFISNKCIQFSKYRHRAIWLNDNSRCRKTFFS